MNKRRIPLFSSLLGALPPAAFAGAALGLFAIAQPSLGADSGGADIAYNLPREAKVSLNILDAKGWIVRELLRADAEQPGSHTVRWDGNDQMGRPMPPGKYSWKLLHHTGFKADYVLSVGNSGQPPYRTDDDKGSWGACHGNPISVQAADTGLYIAWYCEEGNATFAHTDYDGHHLFKIHSAQGWGRNYGCALAGGMIYRLECGHRQLHREIRRRRWQIRPLAGQEQPGLRRQAAHRKGGARCPGQESPQGPQRAPLGLRRWHGHCRQRPLHRRQLPQPQQARHFPPHGRAA